MRAFLAVAVLGAALGCGSPAPELLNAAPTVVVVAVNADAGEAGRYVIDAYVRDVEGDPVDVELFVLRGEGDEEAVVVLDQPGAGWRGLHSEPGAPGALHRLYWRPDGLAAGEMITLRCRGTDIHGATGVDFVTELFEL